MRGWHETSGESAKCWRDATQGGSLWTTIKLQVGSHDRQLLWVGFRPSGHLLKTCNADFTHAEIFCRKIVGRGEGEGERGRGRGREREGIGREREGRGRGRGGGKGGEREGEGEGGGAWMVHNSHSSTSCNVSRRTTFNLSCWFVSSCCFPR